MQRLVASGSWAFGALLFLLGEGSASAYPFGGLRPGEQVIGGPTDGFLSSLHYNPAGLRLFSGSQLLVVAGGRGYFGGFDRSAPLPAGFAPGQTAPQSADTARIAWAASDMFIAGSWDLRTEAVTLGFALYTPDNDETSYGGGDKQGASAQTNPTRYHALYDRTYGLRGTVAVGLRIRPWLYAGAGFQFGYLHSRLAFMRDLDPASGDSLTCAGQSCEAYSQRMLLDLDVAGWGYGFTAGVLAEPIDDRLWIGLSYTSALFTATGSEILLDGQPQRLPWQSGSADEPCGPGGRGVQVTRGDGPTVCGAAHMARSVPHTLYLGARGRIELGQLHEMQGDEIAGDSFEPRTLPSRALPWALDITGWVRLLVPPRDALVLTLDRRVYEPGLLTLPLGMRPAVAVALGVRELWPRLVIAEELLYETPRIDPAAASPMNLDGHKLDLSLAARLRVQRRLWLLLSLGVTGVLFGSDAGTRFDSQLAAACRASGYDVTTAACQEVQNGWAMPTAAGSYWLVVPHGSAGLEVNL